MQRAQNGVARVVTQKPSNMSSIDTLLELHWLPVQWRIKAKLASLPLKVMHKVRRKNLYLVCLLIPYCPSCIFRSSSPLQSLTSPHTHLIFGSRSFRSSDTLHSFRRHLKTQVAQLNARGDRPYCPQSYKYNHAVCI